MAIPKLSTAILLGAMAIPQTCGYEGCAIGAAVYAIGRHHQYNPDYQVKGVSEEAGTAWPFIHTLRVTHPIDKYEEVLRLVIGDLNGYDHLNWTRERIAAWVATVEPQEEEANATTTVSSKVVPAEVPA